MDIYADNILDHYKHPHHHGELADASVEHTEHNPSCGDMVTLHLRIDGDRISEIGWSGDGCAISQASMSMLSDELAGKTLAEADEMTEAQIRALIGVPVGTRRLKCALLGLHTLKNSLRAYRGLPSQSWHETVGNDKETR
jgi:nitrogen fixation protein NifU and related proteins